MVSGEWWWPGSKSLNRLTVRFFLLLIGVQGRGAPENPVKTSTAPHMSISATFSFTSQRILVFRNFHDFAVNKWSVGVNRR